MSLLTKIRSEVSGPSRRCVIYLAKQKLSPLDQKELEEALAIKIPAVAIARALKKELGLQVNGKAIAKHRAKDCSCHS